MQQRTINFSPLETKTKPRFILNNQNQYNRFAQGYYLNSDWLKRNDLSTQYTLIPRINNPHIISKMKSALTSKEMNFFFTQEKPTMQIHTLSSAITSPAQNQQRKGGKQKNYKEEEEELFS